MPGAVLNVYSELHEFEEMAFTLHMLREGDLFIDVGSNIGSYAILAAAAEADVIAFEPGEPFSDLERNVRVNGLSIECHKAAVGAQSGMLRFTIGLDCINHAAVEGEKFVQVPVVRLDDVISRAPTLIKVDVEGYEAAVVEGGTKTFSSALAVIMELNGQGARYGHDEDRILEQMKQWGFSIVGYDPMTRALVAPSIGGNKIFVRGDVSERLRTARKYRTRNHSI